jgi:hypothetical protein
MKPLSTGLYTVVVLLLITSLCPIQAQTTVVAIGAATPLSYDVTEEVTLTGTVSSVLMKAAPGMIVGSHLLLATPSGPVDASLGRFGLQGAGAASVAAGQQIEATGRKLALQGQGCAFLEAALTTLHGPFNRRSVRT